MRLRALLVLLLLFLICAGFRCDNSTRDPKPRPAPPPADLRLMLLTDPRGYLEPCGCQLRPLGGVDKLASVVAEARRTAPNTLALVAGSLTFGSVLRPEDAEGAQQQELWRAETLVDVWSRIGFAAAAPGPLDLSQPPQVIAGLVERGKFPWLIDNLEGDGTTPFSKARIVQAGSAKVGLVGLVAPTPGLVLPEGTALSPKLAETAKQAANQLRSQGAKLVIAMVSADRRAAREVAESGVDVVVLGGVDQEHPLPPVVHAGAIIAHAGYQGQRVVQLDLVVREGAWHDASEWTRREAKSELKKRADELRKKIAAWEKDPKVKASDLESQRARLAELEAELNQGETPDYKGRWFRAELIELSPEVRGEPEISAQMNAYDRRVNEHNRVALADKKPLPAPEGKAHYAGSDSCKSCHQEAYAWWKNTKHGHAYATLEQRHKQFNLSCVGCHVTGYNQPGGSTVTHVEKLKDVGCENCHGPGSLHNAAPEAPGLIARDTPEAVCVSCHNHEHSDRFVYDAFKSLLIVPGHGLPAGTN